MLALPNVDIIRNPVDKQLAQELNLFLEKLKSMIYLFLTSNF
jgi:hypothetical protein